MRRNFFTLKTSTSSARFSRRLTVAGKLSMFGGSLILTIFTVRVLGPTWNPVLSKHVMGTVYVAMG